jgi:lipoprotein-anchoring transpeptidase ErfK/SrfK
VSLQDLIKANNIANPSLIHVGQKIVIPKGGTAPQADPSTGGAKRIVVDLSDQRLYAYQGDQQVFTFVASTGRNNGTRTGSFRILDKEANAWSAPWGFWMPYWLGIYYVGYDLENGIHSLPVLPGGKQIWGDSLGIPVSYGCVVLGPEDSKKLFNWVDVGTPVEIRK